MTIDDKDNQETFHWLEMSGNRFRTIPTSEMLDNSVLLQQNFLITGLTHKDQRDLKGRMNIEYDDDYVRFYIESKIGKIKNHNRFGEIMNKALEGTRWKVIEYQPKKEDQNEEN